MTKTREEFEEYKHQYKSDAITNINSETRRLFDLSNSADLKLGTQLLGLSSVLLAVIGGFIVGLNESQSGEIKVIALLTVLLLVISIFAGLKNLHDISVFWLSAGEHKHKGGAIILDDESVSYDDLVKLRSKLEVHEGEGPTQSDNKARNTQITTFSMGILLVFVLIVIKIFSN